MGTLKADCEKYGVNTDVNARWEQGVPHHERSVFVAHMIAEADYEFLGNCFDLKFGGDGDNGEFLMYILDIIYDLIDAEVTTSDGSVVTISAKEYERLLLVDRHMGLLRARGVDNWQGWCSLPDREDYDSDAEWEQAIRDAVHSW